MKHCILLLTFFVVYGLGLAQSSSINALKVKLAKADSDSAKCIILADMAYFYRLVNVDSGILLSKQSLELARKQMFSAGESVALNSLAQNYRIKGDLVAAMPPLLEAIRVARVNKLQSQLGAAYVSMGNTFVSLKDYKTGADYFRKSIDLLRGSKEYTIENQAYLNLAEAFMLMGKIDSARFFFDSASARMNRLNNMVQLSFYLTRMAQMMFRVSKDDSATYFIRKADSLSILERNFRIRMMVAQLNAEFYQRKSNIDSSIWFSELAFRLARINDYRWDILASANKLAILYKGRDIDKAFFYTETARSLGDSVYGPDVVNLLQRQIINENEANQMREAALLAYQNKFRQNILIGSLVLAGLILFWLLRNNRKDKLTNALLSKQKKEIEHQKLQVENALLELENTQAQLIHAEKMASLGELTAGIAHEIQNPLNFVNNFSEVSRDLLQELVDDIASGNSSSLKEVAKDLDTNLEKIHHHGKRAESIVRSMLQHSRSSSGIAEPTDLNILCDKSVSLAFQGYRSKDSSFSASPQFVFDEKIGNLNIVSADIGRVLINLADNAFYAVAEKSKATKGDYLPKVTITTERKDKEVVITVQDNGEGISSEVIPKVFQPFFTTKATGQGTGLGLSLSYDIIKAHRGTIAVESVVGEGTSFIVTLPI